MNCVGVSGYSEGKMNARYLHIPGSQVPGAEKELLLLDTADGQILRLKPGSPPRWVPITPAVDPDADREFVAGDIGRPFPWLVAGGGTEPA